MLPLLLSLAATISIMIFCDIRLNYMNVVAFPLIIGIGIDDSIHMIYRYYENHERSVGTMVEQTGRAVLLTSLTTMSGFGSLLVTDHSGLMSLGMVTALGIGFCLVTSLLILPGLLLFWESSGPFRLR
jgi:predicted RND superfamily exporter protein